MLDYAELLEKSPSFKEEWVIFTSIYAAKVRDGPTCRKVNSTDDAIVTCVFIMLVVMLL